MTKFATDNQPEYIGREEALEYLRFVRESLHNDANAPEDVVEKTDELMRAVDNAEQFIMILRVTDMGMIDDVRRIRHELQVMVPKRPTVH